MEVFLLSFILRIDRLVSHVLIIGINPMDVALLRPQSMSQRSWFADILVS